MVMSNEAFQFQHKKHNVTVQPVITGKYRYLFWCASCLSFSYCKKA